MNESVQWINAILAAQAEGKALDLLGRAEPASEQAAHAAARDEERFALAKDVLEPLFKQLNQFCPRVITGEATYDEYLAVVRNLAGAAELTEALAPPFTINVPLSSSGADGPLGEPGESGDKGHRQLPPG